MGAWLWATLELPLLLSSQSFGMLPALAPFSSSAATTS